MTDCKVVHPAPQDRIDELNHPPDGLGLKAAEDLFELAHQGSALPEFWRIVGAPLPLPAAYPPKRKPQEVEAFPFAQVQQPTLLGIDLDLDLGQLFPESFGHRRHEPVMPRIGIH